MKVLAISDLHGRYPQIPPCDVLLLAGDLLPNSRGSEVGFEFWLHTVPAQHILFVPGNHDIPIGERWVSRIPKAHNLLLGPIIIGGIVFGGFGWNFSPYLPDMALIWPRTSCSKEEMLEKCEQIPYCDVMVSHSPPICSGLDWVKGNKGPVYLGVPGLLSFALQRNVRIMVCGHVHERGGTFEQLDGLSVYNVAGVLTDLSSHF